MRNYLRWSFKEKLRSRILKSLPCLGCLLECWYSSFWTSGLSSSDSPGSASRPGLFPRRDFCGAASLLTRWFGSSAANRPQSWAAAGRRRTPGSTRHRTGSCCTAAGSVSRCVPNPSHLSCAKDCFSGRSCNDRISQAINCYSF